jgi:hypothetical protein
MLNVQVIIDRDSMYPETKYSCPFCNKHSWFYSTPNKVCYGCNKALPNVKEMKFNYEYRLQWHIGNI